jgi:hypothetical protein
MASTARSGHEHTCNIINVYGRNANRKASFCLDGPEECRLGVLYRTDDRPGHWTKHLHGVLVQRGPGSLDPPDAVARAGLDCESASTSASMYRECLGNWLTCLYAQAHYDTPVRRLFPCMHPDLVCWHATGVVAHWPRTDNVAERLCADGHRDAPGSHQYGVALAATTLACRW